MGTSKIPKFVADNYDIRQWRHALSILIADFPKEGREIVEVLAGFRLHRSEILVGGGGKSLIAGRIDNALIARGWREKFFDTHIVVDGEKRESPTHKVDCFKNRIGLEIEWNNKTEFYDRDLNNFRLLFELRALSVGVIVTRTTGLQGIFRGLGKKVAEKYGSSTTHLDKLLPKIEGGGGGGCPILVFGITDKLYVED